MQISVNRQRVVGRVIGNPVQEGGQLIEITMDTRVLRAQLMDYGLRILALSALFSAVFALLGGQQAQENHSWRTGLTCDIDVDDLQLSGQTSNGLT